MPGAWAKFAEDAKKTAKDEWDSLTQLYRDISTDTRDFIDAETHYSDYSSPQRVQQKPSQVTPSPHQRARLPIPIQAHPAPTQTMAYRRRRYGFKKRGMRRRFRRGRRRFRRKAKWGTRVRRAAIRMGESKRNQEHENGMRIATKYPSDWTATASRFKNRVYYRELCDMSHITDVSTAESQKTRRKGTFVCATGLKLNISFKNILTGTGVEEPQPVFVRMILGYKRRDRQSQATFEGSPAQDWDKDAVKIFKEIETEHNVPLWQFRDSAGLNSYHVMQAPLDRHYVKVWKDYKFRLLASNVQDTAQNIAHMKIWLPFRNRPIKFENDTAADAEDTNWWPCMWIYACSAEQNDIPAGTIAEDKELLNVDWHSTLYFRDP